MQREQFLAHAELEDHHWWFTARREILRAVVAAVAPPAAGLALLDVGCGTGGNAAAFATSYRTMGIDPSPDAIALARQRFPTVRFERSDDPAVGREHLAGGGVLLMTDVLEHVAGDHELFARAVAVVPSGSHLVITVPADPTLWSSHDVEFGHVRRYQPETLRALWRDAPVDERLFSPYNARLLRLIRFWRRFAPRRGGGGGDLRVGAGPFTGWLRRQFAAEAGPLVAAIDRGTAPYAAGVSLIAVLRRR